MLPNCLRRIRGAAYPSVLQSVFSPVSTLHGNGLLASPCSNRTSHRHPSHHDPTGSCSMLLAVSSRLTQMHITATTGILISCMCTGKGSRSFPPGQIHSRMLPCLLKELNLLTDILKAGQHLNQLYAVGCRNRHLAILVVYDSLLPVQPIIRHGNRLPFSSRCESRYSAISIPAHISGKGHVLACLGVLCINTQPVGIRVCCQNDIRILLLCQTAAHSVNAFGSSGLG